MRKTRFGKLNPNCTKAIGDKFQLLACESFGWIDLNEENDNFEFPIDCLDPKTGFKYQIKGKFSRLHNNIECWDFTKFDKDWEKEYRSMICFCASKDGNTIERIYEIPIEEIKIRRSITIVKNPKFTRLAVGYEKFRIKEEEKLKRIDNIWKRIISK